MTWEDLRLFTHVEALWIRFGSDRESLTHLTELPRLKELHLHTPLDEQSIRDIVALRILEHLEFCGCNGCLSLPRGAYDPLGSLTELRSFSVTVAATGDDDLLFLRQCPKFWRLYLRDVGVTGRVLQDVRHLPALEELVLLGCRRIRSEDLQHVKALKTLRTCRVYCNGRSVPAEVLESLPLLENDPQRVKTLGTFGNRAYEKLKPWVHDCQIDY